jgi:hypothetical protein
MFKRTKSRLYIMACTASIAASAMLPALAEAGRYTP